MSEKVKDLVQEIAVNLSQKSASQKDEVRVMQAMLNDKTYVVGEYNKSGKVGEYCPYDDSRKMIANVISAAAKVPAAESKQLASEYEFTKSDANVMVGISKEFVNTYVGTGRKLPLGGRENMNVSLQQKKVDEKKKQFPVNGVGSSERGEVTIPAHVTLKASGPCPVWLKK